MILTQEYEDFHEAFIDNFKLVYSEPHFTTNLRGRWMKERLNCHFVIKNPRDRACYLPARKTNIIFNFAEALWHLSGDNTLDYISYYAKIFHRFSPDKKTLPGSAYGPKIFSFGPNKVNQWNKIVELLSTDDVNSNRAIIQIFDPDEKVLSNHIDVSCTLGLHFLIRDNRLYLSCAMRGNDAYRGIVSDIFCFTFMQELMAKQLGVELGAYFHNVSSMNLFTSDDEAIEHVINGINTTSATHKSPYSFPSLPDGNNWEHINTVLKYERILRKNEAELDLIEIEALDIPRYWQEVIMLFSLYQNIVNHKPVDINKYQSLSKPYQYLLANKWPMHFVYRP